MLTTRSARDGERKDVTILFADIAGSLRMAEALDPEDIHEIMDGFFAIALEAVHDERGTINQFRGDGFMALFGAPLARGEEAARALRAALRIRSAVAPYAEQVQERFGLPLLLRMGLHTGTVWVGSVGGDRRLDYTAEGPTVGLAARLEEAASPGQILLSAETERRVRSLFEFRELGERPLRGADRPICIFELVGLGPYRDRFEAEQALGLTRFVGRQRELAWLGGALEQREASGPRVIQVLGEAGIGKSRLIFEALRTSACRLLEGRAREVDSHRAYSAWLEILARWPASVAGGQEAAALAQRFSGKSGSPPATRDDFVDQLGQQLALAAGDGHLIVAIEDAQWLDPSSRDVFCSLLRCRELASCVLLASSREPVAGLAAAAAGRGTLELGALGASESRELAAAVLRGLRDSEELVELAVARGGGNPLFIEEVARTLRDGSEELRRAARLEARLRKLPERVPETLREVIAARIDALPDPGKRLLQYAAVVGVPCDLEFLVELAAQTDGGAVVKSLLRHGLLGEKGNRLDFRHVLFRDVTYDQILLARRRELHARCAALLLRHKGSDTASSASQIGFHFERAGRPREAAHYLFRAGRAYLNLYAPAEAADHLARAWELLGDPVTEDVSEGELHVSLGLTLVSALNALDRAGDAACVLEKLESSNLAAADRREVARAYIEGGWVRFSQNGEVLAGRREIERGLALAQATDSRDLLELSARSYLARLHTLDGSIDKALEHADALAGAALKLDQPVLRVNALCNRVSALCYRGEIASALAIGLEAQDLAEEINSDLAKCFASGYLSRCLVFSGVPEQALQMAACACELAQSAGQAGILSHATIARGEAYLLLDEPESAYQEFERLVEINPRWPSTPHRRARGLLALGKYADAACAAEECLALNPPRTVEGPCRATLGLALELVGSPESRRADEELYASAALLERLELRPYLAETKEVLARVWRNRGEESRARRYQAEAIELYRGCGMELHASRVGRH